MLENEVDQPLQAADETAAEAEGAAGTGDSDVAAAFAQQAATSDGTAAEAEPEVPDDAGDTIARAQEHIEKLNMDREREAAKRAI